METFKDEEMVQNHKGSVNLEQSAPDRTATSAIRQKESCPKLVAAGNQSSILRSHISESAKNGTTKDFAKE
jgi:hypothetical protein